MQAIPGLTDLSAAAERLWSGLPFLWQEELRVFEAYVAHVGQAPCEAGLTLWMERVQAGRCPVVGSACDRPKQGRFCEHHRPGALAGT